MRLREIAEIIALLDPDGEKGKRASAWLRGHPSLWDRIKNAIRGMK
jgi:hypothetical protein